MGYKVGVPLNEQKLTTQTTTQPAAPVRRGWTKDSMGRTIPIELEGLSQSISRLELFNLTNDMVKDKNNFLNLLDVYCKELINALRTLSFTPKEIFNIFFKNNSTITQLVGACPDENNITIPSIIFDYTAQEFYSKDNTVNTSCLSPNSKNPAIRYTKSATKLIRQVEEKKNRIEMQKTDTGRIQIELLDFGKSLPKEISLVQYFSGIDNNPFSSSEENTKFRTWVNKVFPEFADNEVDLNSLDPKKTNKLTNSLKKSLNYLVYDNNGYPYPLYMCYLFNSVSGKNPQVYTQIYESKKQFFKKESEILSKINQSRADFYSTMSKNESLPFNEKSELLWRIASIYDSLDYDIMLQSDPDWDITNIGATGIANYPVTENAKLLVSFNYSNEFDKISKENSSVSDSKQLIGNFLYNLKNQTVTISLPIGNFVGTYENSTNVQTTKGNINDVLLTLKFPNYNTISNVKNITLNDIINIGIVEDVTKKKDDAETKSIQYRYYLDNKNNPNSENDPNYNAGELITQNPCFDVYTQKIKEYNNDPNKPDKNKNEIDAWLKFIDCMESGMSSQQFLSDNYEIDSPQELESIKKSYYVIKTWTNENNIKKTDHGAYTEEEVDEAWNSYGTMARDFLRRVSQGVEYANVSNSRPIGKPFWDNVENKWKIYTQKIPKGGTGSPWYADTWNSYGMYIQIAGNIVAAIALKNVGSTLQARLLVSALIDAGVNGLAAYLDYDTGNLGKDNKIIWLDIFCALLPMVLVDPAMSSLVYGKFGTAGDKLAEKIKDFIDDGLVTETSFDTFWRGLLAEEKQVYLWMTKNEGATYFENASKGVLSKQFEKFRNLYSKSNRIPNSIKEILDDLLETDLKTGKLSVSRSSRMIAKASISTAHLTIQLGPMIMVSSELYGLMRMLFCQFLLGSTQGSDLNDCAQTEFSEDTKKKIYQYLENQSNFDKIIEKLNKNTNDVEDKKVLIDLFRDVFGVNQLGIQVDSDGNIMWGDEKSYIEFINSMSESDEKKIINDRNAKLPRLFDEISLIEKNYNELENQFYTVSSNTENKLIIDLLNEDEKINFEQIEDSIQSQEDIILDYICILLHDDYSEYCQEYYKNDKFKGFLLNDDDIKEIETEINNIKTKIQSFKNKFNELQK